MSKDTFRVVQPKSTESVLIDACDCPVKAFTEAELHNRSVEVDYAPRDTYVVYRGKDRVYG